MTDEPRKRIAKAIGAGSFGTLVTVLVRFVEIPVFLSCWSLGLYGEWLILSALPTFLSMANLGLHSAAANDMTMRVAAGDRRGAVATLHTALAVLAALSALVMIVAICASLLPLQSILNFEHFGVQETSWVFIALTVSMLCRMFVDLVWECYRACGIYHLGLLGRNILRLVEFVVIIAVIVSGGRPTAVVLAATITVVLGGVLGQVWLNQRHGWIRFGVAQASLSVVGRLWSAAFGFLLFPLAQAVLNQGIVFTLGRVISPAAVVAFVTVRTLCHLLQQIVGLIQRSFWPEFSIAFGRHDIALARRLHRNACRAALGVTVLAAVALGLFGPGVYELWTRGKCNLATDVFWGFLVLLTWRSVWETSCVAIIAINKTQRLAVVYLLASLLALGLSVALSSWLGLVGAVIAIGVFDLIMTVEVLPSSLFLVQDNLKAFTRSFFSLPTMQGTVEARGWVN